MKPVKLTRLIEEERRSGGPVRKTKRKSCRSNREGNLISTREK